MFILSLSLSRLCASKAGAVGSTPGWRTKIPRATQRSKKQTNKQKKLPYAAQLD